MSFGYRSTKRASSSLFAATYGLFPDLPDNVLPHTAIEKDLFILIQHVRHPNQCKAICHHLELILIFQHVPCSNTNERGL